MSNPLPPSALLSDETVAETVKALEAPEFDLVPSIRKFAEIFVNDRAERIRREAKLKEVLEQIASAKVLDLDGKSLMKDVFLTHHLKPLCDLAKAALSSLSPK